MKQREYFRALDDVLSTMWGKHAGNVVGVIRLLKRRERRRIAKLPDRPPRRDDDREHRTPGFDRQ